MGREVRKVPADWQHPRTENGGYVPLMSGAYRKARDEWDEAERKWDLGYQEVWRPNEAREWKSRDKEYDGVSYGEYSGRKPMAHDYMPQWETSDCTHVMMYESTLEGAPISPAFETPEELAKWLADTGASSFAGMTASYDAWLRIAEGGFAPSVMIVSGVMHSGVEALGETSSTKEPA